MTWTELKLLVGLFLCEDCWRPKLWRQSGCWRLDDKGHIRWRCAKCWLGLFRRAQG